MQNVYVWIYISIKTVQLSYENLAQLTFLLTSLKKIFGL